MFKKTLLLVSLSSTVLFSGMANAVVTQTDPQDMQVTLQVLKACTLSTGNLDFNSVTSDSGAQEQTTTANVTCTKNTDYFITATSANNFTMKPVSTSTGTTNTSVIPYTISAKTATEDSRQDLTANGAKARGTGTGSNESVTIYGDVTASALQNAAEGDYADKVTLTVNY